MELVRLHSRGGFSVRSIVMFCLAVIMTVFLWTTVSSTPAQAQVPDNATWQNETTILHGGNAYEAAGPSLDNSHGITEGSIIYTYTEPQTGSASAPRGAHFIYFAPGTDPPTATSAQYARYTYVDGQFSNPQDQKSITMTPFGEDTEYSSCEVSGGLGWIICPVTIFLANTMDSLFDQVTHFLAVKPLTLDTGSDNGLYNVWNVMRNIANIAFVIAFLIIIYTQITSMGVSSYGMKKMIPRLVVAAILVNVSFVVSALAIDISNILGFSIQDILVSIRENAFYMTDDTTAGNAAFNSDITRWSTITAAILGGGAGLWVAVSSGTIFFLFPLLASLALTLFVVLIVLAARQAIIIILVIIAPLAFVANLLPNTEKWFGKWRDLFMTMLVFFPAFSLVFGGSQLAGQIIIQNAGDDLIMVLFGMAVQVAPLVITPLILKLSGNLLGKIMQIANNPNKGLVDRTRNFSKSMAEQQKRKTLGKPMKGATKMNLGARMVQSGEKRRRLREDRTKMYGAEGDNRYHEDKRYEKIFDGTEAAKLDSERLHNEHQAHFEKQRHTPPAPGTRQRRNYESIYDRSLRAEAAKDKLAEQQAHTAGHYDTLRTVGGTPLNESRNRLEAAKGNAEAAAQNLNAYHSERRTFQSTEMGKAAINLETAKLNAEGQQSKLTAHLEGLKVKEGTTLQTAAKFAQESKEHAEAAQNRVQTMFERDRATEGAKLNVSNIALEKSKLTLDEAKSATAVYVNKAKSDLEGVLHVQNVKTEAAKVAMQKSESHLTRIVEEYKSGKVEGAGELKDVVKTMVSDVVENAAETRGIQAAQNMQKQTIASAFNAGDKRAEELLGAAASVDPQGKIRARASAAAQMAAVEKEALANNRFLLEEEADEKRLRPTTFAKQLYDKFRGTKDTPPEYVDPGLLEAALDIMAEDGAIGDIRKAVTKLTPDEAAANMQMFDQSMIQRVVGRHNGAIMAKGGADIVLNNLSGTEDGVDPDQMAISVAGWLTGVKGTDINGLKFGWWEEVSKNIGDIANTVDRVQPDKSVNPRTQSDYQKGIVQFYETITKSLRSPEIYNSLSSVQKEQTLRIYDTLHERYKNPEFDIDRSKLGS